MGGSGERIDLNRRKSLAQCEDESRADGFDIKMVPL
jgi:hypothetical protein